MLAPTDAAKTRMKKGHTSAGKGNAHRTAKPCSNVLQLTTSVDVHVESIGKLALLGVGMDVVLSLLQAAPARSVVGDTVFSLASSLGWLVV